MTKAARGTVPVAKLFSGLAILTLVYALLRTPQANLPSDVLLRDTYYVVYSPSLLPISALLMGVFAFGYFVAASWLSRPLNNSLALIHFIVTSVGVFLIVFADRALTQNSFYVVLREPEKNSTVRIWPLRALAIGAASLAMGGVIFLVNVSVMATKSSRR